ncbi:MAG TPA: methyltransferase domain-containing protein [Chloroflexota bacterium]|jgi:SAM-dependent methyltransferase|nr:methyltransferase domain-containing protein [Chloroflexota bacterium]
MADVDRQRWNERYRNSLMQEDFAPADWLVSMAERLEPATSGARALDLAAGSGRQALFLAGLGYTVDAWDISDVALAALRAEVTRRAIGGTPLPVQTRLVDLERTPIQPAAYDLILDKHYLDRQLFGPLALALRPAGLLVVHTFLFVAGGPNTARLSNPAHALQPGELQAAFGAALEVLELSEDTEREEVHLLARQQQN